MNNIIKKSIFFKNKYNTLDNLIKNYNIKIEYFYNEELEVKAFTSIVNNINTIYINDNLNEYEYDLVLAHEIGHILFHDNSSRSFANIRIIKNDKEEIEANIFSIIFLKLRYNDYENSKMQNIINYIYCNYLINNKDYYNYIIDCDYIS